MGSSCDVDYTDLQRDAASGPLASADDATEHGKGAHLFIEEAAEKTGKPGTTSFPDGPLIGNGAVRRFWLVHRSAGRSDTWSGCRVADGDQRQVDEIRLALAETWNVPPPTSTSIRASLSTHSTYPADAWQRIDARPSEPRTCTAKGLPTHF